MVNEIQRADPGGTRDRATRDPSVTTLMMVNGYRVAQIIHVVSKLGIPDLLAAGSQSARELATSCAADADALFRVLRAAAALGIFRQNAQGWFENTELSGMLQSRNRFSLYDAALLLGEFWHWSMWGEILNTVKGGSPAFERLFGSDVRTYWVRNTAVGSRFRAAIEALLSLETPAVLSMYDFTGCRHVVYLGYWGGYLSFVVGLIEATSGLRATVLELPENVDSARANVNSAGIGVRCSIVGAEPLFASLPQEADVHIYRHLLNYYGDDGAVELLSRSYQALSRKSGRLLVMAMIVPPPNVFGLGKILDLEAMLVSSGAKERTESEYRRLLRKAGFRVRRIVRRGSPTAVIEAVRR